MRKAEALIALQKDLVTFVNNRLNPPQTILTIIDRATKKKKKKKKSGKRTGVLREKYPNPVALPITVRIESKTKPPLDPRGVNT